MSVLAEAESLASYGRKGLALSYERPISQSKPKSHSPNVQSMTWDIPNAMRELENLSPNENIYWTVIARQHNLSSKNAVQVLKETAKNIELTPLGLSTKRIVHLEAVDTSVGCLGEKCLYHVYLLLKRSRNSS